MPTFVQDYSARRIGQGASLTHVVRERKSTPQVAVELLHGHLDLLVCLIVSHFERSQGGNGEEGTVEQRPTLVALAADELLADEDHEVLRKRIATILGEEEMVLTLVAPLLWAFDDPTPGPVT